MKLAEITGHLERLAPLNYQEDYDNSGLIVGQKSDEVTSALVALDCTEEVVDEAIRKGCNLIITHHPIVFKGLKKFNGTTYVERVVMKAIKNNIALYAIHTNLDHVSNGVSAKIASMLGLEATHILAPKAGLLKKLVCYCPQSHVEPLKAALFNAGAGEIGKYSECSFSSSGTGTFKAGVGADPFVGDMGVRHEESEYRIEVIYKVQDERSVVSAMKANHPYEEVAYDLLKLDNFFQEVGAGMVGTLPQPMSADDFLAHLKTAMQVEVIRYTRPPAKLISKVAVCGGSGSFLLKNAQSVGADAYVTADFKYHEFFDAENKLMICDIGHYESEQFTSSLLLDFLKQAVPDLNASVSETNTNPVHYYF